jgi:hypothetical protein
MTHFHYYPTRFILLLLLSPLFLIACTPTPSVSPWEVSPNLYSGIENPQRQLSVEEAEQLETMLADLPAGTVSERGGLGYQGFMVRRQGQVAADGITTIIVYDGIVEVIQQKGAYYLGDPDRTLERWLFDRTKGILSEREIQGIEADLNGN